MILCFTRKHWIATLPLVVPYLLYLSVLIVFFAMISQFQLPSLNEPFFELLVILVILSTGYATHRFFLKMINYFLNVIVITNFRIIEISKTVFVHDDQESIDIDRIEDIQIYQVGLVENLLKWGELHIILGNGEVKPMTQIPNPNFFFRLINKIKSDLLSRGKVGLEAARQHRDIGNSTVKKPESLIEKSGSDHLPIFKDKV